MDLALDNRGCPDCMLIHHLDEHVLVAVKFLCGDEHPPIDHLDEVLLQLIQILEGYPADAGDVVVRKEDVIVEFCCDEHSGKNEPVQRDKVGLSSQSCCDKGYTLLQGKIPIKVKIRNIG